MEWLAPLVATILAAVVGITGAILNYRSQRSGAKEQRAPDVNEAWAETRLARRREHIIEELFYDLRGLFKNLARRVSDRYPDFELTDQERAGLEMKPPD